MYSLLQDLSHGTIIIFDLVTLTLKFDLILKKLNLDCYLVMVAARRASLSSINSYSSVCVNSNLRVLKIQKIFTICTKRSVISLFLCPSVCLAKQRSESAK